MFEYRSAAALHHKLNMSSVKQQDLLSAMVNALRVSIITIEVATILNHTVIQLYGRRQAIGQLVLGGTYMWD